jgi:integrase
VTAYADAIAKPPRTLTDLEQKLIMKTTGEHRDGYRDHCIISLALGTGLREHELLALDMGDVFGDDGRARRRVSLRASNAAPTSRRSRRSCCPT